MNGYGIDQKIRFGYAKAAKKLGQTFELYRSATPFTPLATGNLIGSLPAVVTVDWQWMKSNKPGNAIWWILIDGQDSSAPLSAQEGDYLVGDQTFFILTKEYQMPMSAVECNRVVDIIRPSQSIDAGNQGYVAYTPPTSNTIMEGMPISILKDRAGNMAESKLPTDTDQPRWIIQMPNLGGVKILTGDIMIDEIGDNYVISLNEESEFGWRLTAKQVVNNKG